MGKLGMRVGVGKVQDVRLYSEQVVTTINGLNMPRYGLGNYIGPGQKQHATAAEKQQLASLSRAGKRLMGFCRTNLFKRLESGGAAFIQSIERHVFRNFIFLHALALGLDLPIGTPSPHLLDVPHPDEHPT